MCRDGDALVVVGDKEDGGYLRAPVPGGEDPYPVIAGGSRVALSDPRAQDLEGIARLADGRVVVLSERNHCLISAEGVVIQYDDTLREFAGRGLEGLAVRSGAEGGSWVAVLWEGGYPRTGRSPASASDSLSMLPLLVVHPLEPDAQAVVHSLEAYPALPLQVPLPEGDEPGAQRFRAPELVWYRFPGGPWGFIVLLSSESPGESPRYHHRWLLRFDGDGTPVGDPVDLEAGLPGPLRGLNWEGLDWFTEGRRLILVHDDPDPAAGTRALLVTLPADW